MAKKGDPDKQYDVIVSVFHDNREGITKAVQKSVRISFATEEEALEFAEKITKVEEEKDKEVVQKDEL